MLKLTTGALLETPPAREGSVNSPATLAATSTSQRRQTMTERPPNANRAAKAARTPIRRRGNRRYRPGRKNAAAQVVRTACGWCTPKTLVEYYKDGGARAAEEVAKIPDPNVRQFVKTELDYILKSEK
ncbi:hypothetical protein MTO96_022699 [Rhipicephalus appendiculatus]